MAKKFELDVIQRVKDLRMHKEAYYSGKPVISDAEFDTLEEELKTFVPRHHYFNQVGAKLSGTIPVKHPVPMLSMDKVKEIHEIATWLTRVDMPIETLLCTMPKVDGISGDLEYENNGLFLKASTRGDGDEGSLIPFPEEIQGIPPKLPYQVPVNVRGEFYLPQHLKTSNPYFADKSLRNFCYGILSRETKTEDLKYVRFVAYDMVGTKDILNGPISMKAMLDYLEMFFPEVVPRELISLASIPGLGNVTAKEFVDSYLNKYRDEWPYETDGLIFTIDNKMLHRRIDKAQGGAKKFHHFNIALKPPSRKSETSIVGIDWKVSKHGNVIPVGILEPIKIGGVEVTNVTLNNATTVKELGLMRGATVIVERANDVIPKLLQVIEQGVPPAFEPPKNCPSCNSVLIPYQKHMRCNNRNCGGRRIALINHWVEQCDILNVGEKVIEDLYNCGAIKNIADLYTTDIDAVLSVIPGYTSGGSRIAKINESLKASIGMSELDVISRMGIPGVGIQVLKNLKIFGVKDLMAYMKDSSYRLEVEKSIHSWISEPENLTQLMTLTNVLKATHQPKTLNVISKRVIFAITGNFPKSRDEIIEYLENKGYEFSNNVTARTTCLIRGEGRDGLKVVKAEGFGIPIVNSVEEFEKTFP